MADEQVPQPPTAPAGPSFWDKLNTPIKSLWENNKGFIIVFGLLILIIQFRQVILDMLISGARKELDTAKTKDAQLASEEKQANDQANKLVDEAKHLSDNKPEVKDDWYKNGK